MTAPKPFTLGVIEGFFGRDWPWPAREAMASFLTEQGYDAYFYAPKGDHWLRRHWHKPLPREQAARLATLASHCRAVGLAFGVGLSPVELYRDFGAGNRRLLRDKLEQLRDLGLDSLCLLFDDMRGDFPDLAPCQAEIVELATTLFPAAQLKLCPTYYSHDPVLRRQFGQDPAGYLEDLGRLLNPAVDIFWTGPRVISSDYPAAHLAELGAQLGRPPTLWDNYPVNDAKRLTSFLHLRPPARQAAVIQAHCRGLFANPMNQAWLSRLPLAGLAATLAPERGVQGDGERGERGGRGKLAESDALEPLASAVYGEDFGRRLLIDLDRFQDQGLEALDAASHKTLLSDYNQWATSAAAPRAAREAAAEIVDWLQGGYTFDPACLT